MQVREKPIHKEPQNWTLTQQEVLEKINCLLSFHSLLNILYENTMFNSSCVLVTELLPSNSSLF
jgi:hypothetical protein